MLLAIPQTPARFLQMNSCPPPAAPRAKKPTFEAVVLSVIALIVLANTLNWIHNSLRLTRVARLVGINSYLSVSDEQLDEAAKSEFPVGMTEREAIQKLEGRDLYQHSYYRVVRESEDEESTEHFVVLVEGLEFSLVMKEYLLVLAIDTDSHRIKHSEVTYGLTGF
jgi:hypothetical protein